MHQNVKRVSLIRSFFDAKRLYLKLAKLARRRWNVLVRSDSDPGAERTK